MIYLKVHWNHESEKLPIAFYCELDGDRMEVRKVELFADGSLGYANEKRSSGKTILGALPMPPMAELSASPNYTPAEITRDEFEDVWRLARWE
ncbi:MAG: hypothetical protein OEY16_11230 [Alphaproteobacteria bacterium]|nr:hypothetical protein [Alphaproteobacteria bacterium]